VIFGQDGLVGLPLATGEFFLTKSILLGGVIEYDFHYRQEFEIEPGEPPLELNISRLGFRARDGEPLSSTLVLGDQELTHTLFLEGAFSDEKQRKARRVRKDHGEILTFSSCQQESLPLFESIVELDDGTRVELDERFDPALAMQNSISPASLVFAHVEMGGESRTVRSYWDLVYSADKHNEHLEYWIVLDPSMVAPDVMEPVHIIEIIPPQPEDPVVIPGASYLGEKFELLASRKIASHSQAGVTEPRFRRGDADSSGKVELVDVGALLEYLFLEGSVPGCQKAADTNDDGELELTDALLIVLHLFRGRTPFPHPADFCGRDDTPDALSCSAFSPCGGS
jgi:hypothetical protein